MLYLMSRF